MERATWTMEAYLNGAWVDITADCLNTTSAEWGLSGNKPTDLVADVGTLEFGLQNFNPVGKYSPSHTNCISGWKKGVPVRQVFRYDGTQWRVIRRYVDDIANAGGRDERKRITAVDWMEYAARNPIKNPGILEDKRGDEVLTSTLALMPIPPQAVDFDEGINTFPTAFDTVTSKTKAISEFVKVALSELGMVYIRNDPAYGETLRFENAQARHGLRTLTEYEGKITDSGILLTEDGDTLELEDGSGNIEIDFSRPTLTLHLDNDASVLAYDFEDGENIINRFTVYAVPRKVDTSAQVLFRLSSPQPIASGQTITIKGTYANPDGGLPVNANPDDMINPAATTDYKAFVNSDSTGTEFTASLTVTPSYGTEGFSHTVYNGSGNTGFVTLFNCRGYGIYTYNPIEHQANDTASQDANGIISDALTQKYKNDLSYGSLYADFVVDEEKEPRTTLNKIYLTANKDSAIMAAFLQMDIGHIIRVTEDKTETDSYYFIQGISQKTRPGGIIMFEWTLKSFLCLALGLSQVAVEFDKTKEDTINFGYNPTFDGSKMDDLTLSVWVYPYTYNSPYSSFPPRIIDYYSEGSIFNLGIYWTGSTRYVLFSTRWEGNAGTFNSVPAVSQNQWSLITVTYQNGVAGKIYVDGVLQSLATNVISTGNVDNGPNSPGVLLLGNQFDNINKYKAPFHGKMKDVRIYKRVLSASEITTLYNGGVPDMNLVTDGLKFQAFVVPTSRLTSYINATLTSDMKLRDRIYGVIGTPHGAPIGRTP